MARQTRAGVMVDSGGFAVSSVLKPADTSAYIGAAKKLAEADFRV